jgi:O-antigen/teichoic acid export membrane protein
MQLLLQVGLIGLPLFSLGANTMVFRFFPKFRDEKSGHHGFLSLLLLMVGVGVVGTWGVVALSRPLWAPWFALQSPALTSCFWMSVPLSFFFVFSTLLSLYAANFNRIVVPSVLLDFSQKLVLPLLLGLVWGGVIAMETALYGLLLHAGLVTLGMVLYLRRLGVWYLGNPFPHITPALRREMLRFTGFSLAGGFALLVAAKADLLMVGTTSTLENTGIYAIAAYLAAIIDVPTKSLYGASVALVADHLNKDNREELGVLYRKVSINLLSAGLLLFGAIWVSVDYLFALLPEGGVLARGKYVLFFVGISRLVEMGTGLNNYLVYYSRYYLYAVLSLVGMAVLNVSLSLFLIPRLGISGAAVATLVSIVGYNAVSVGLVWRLFGLQPFTKHTLRVLALGLSVWAVVSLLPPASSAWLNLVVHSGLYLLFYGILLLWLRISPDLNEAVAVLRRQAGF